MADFRSLTISSGVTKQIQDADSLIVGAGIKTVAGNLVITPGGTDVQVAAGKNISFTGVGAGAVDFSTQSGAFKTTTGAVTLGPGAVAVSGAVTLGAGIGITATAGAGAFDLSSATGIFKTSTGAVTVGPGAVTVSGATTFTALGTALTVNNNMLVSGNLTVGGSQTFNGGLVLGSAGNKQWVALDGLTTTAMTSSGSAGCLSSNNTLAKTDNAAMSTARFFGAYQGVSGQMAVSGVISDMQFTTAGGTPAAGGPVFLAAAADDTNTGSGKLTAIAPSAVGAVVAEVGICLDNTNYAGSKTAKVLLQVKAPVQL